MFELVVEIEEFFKAISSQLTERKFSKSVVSESSSLGIASDFDLIGTATKKVCNSLDSDEKLCSTFEIRRKSIIRFVVLSRMEKSALGFASAMQSSSFQRSPSISLNVSDHRLHAES